MSSARNSKIIRRFLNVVVTVATVVAAFLIRQGLQQRFGIALPPFFTFYPAVMIVAVIFGLWPGLLATVLSALLMDYFILEPYGFGIASTSDAVGLTLFSAFCFFICILADRYRTYKERIVALDSERALQETRTELEAALASMSDAVFISDMAGNFVDSNEAFATFHKFRDKTECALNLAEYPALFDVFLPSGEPVPLEMWAVSRALRGESAANAEYKILRKDTGESWVGSYNFAPVRDKDGAIVGSVVTARDISAQKRAEQAAEKHIV